MQVKIIEAPQTFLLRDFFFLRTLLWAIMSFDPNGKLVETYNHSLNLQEILRIQMTTKGQQNIQYVVPILPIKINKICQTKVMKAAKNNCTIIVKNGTCLMLTDGRQPLITTTP